MVAGCEDREGPESYPKSPFKLDLQTTCRLVSCTLSEVALQPFLPKHSPKRKPATGFPHWSDRISLRTAADGLRARLNPSLKLSRSH